jgi:toxin ParE1/3/4
MRPVWSEPASRDLRELVSYIARDSTQNAELVRTRILKSVELLGEMPYAGRPGRVSGTRERVVSRTPFILVY